MDSDMDSIYPAQFRVVADKTAPLREGERLTSDLNGTLIAIRRVERWEEGGLVEDICNG